MDSKITYNVIKSADISLAMDASSASISAGLKVSKNDATVWNHTVATIFSIVDLEGVSRDTSKDGVKKVGDVLKSAMAKHILNSITLPEKGKDRQGKTFDVCDKKGIPKWSSWDKTRRIWAYLGDIAKIINFSQEGVLYPEKGKVAARCDVLKLCKAEEPLKKSISRLAGELQDRLDKVDTRDEILHAHHEVQNLMVNNLGPVEEAEGLISRLDSILSAVEGEERDSIRDAFKVLIPHFQS